MNLKAVMVFVVVLVFNSMAITSTQAKTGYHVGDTAANFSLKTLHNKKVSLTQLRQKGYVLLVFWAVDCVYCYSHIKEFNALHEQYHAKGLTVAAINIAGEYDIEVAEYAKENNLKYLLLSDRLNNIDVAEAYHIVGTPTMVLVSPEGKIVYYGYDIPEVGKWLK